jgi:hypothetical protein
MRRLRAYVCLLVMILPCATRADILFYGVITTADEPLKFEGTVRVDSKDVVTLQHPQFGTLYFGAGDVKFFRAPSTLSIAQQKLKRAKQDPKACIEAARWALHTGHLPEFYKAAAAAWAADRNDPTVQRLANLKRRMDAPVPVHKEQEDEMRKFVVIGKDMEFVRSKHFLLMHNTKPTQDVKATKGKRNAKTPAETRLELLETVYETFLLKFYLEGLELEVPKEHLKVVLFADRADYLAMGEANKEDHSKAAGFYNLKSNTAVFYDQGTGEGFKELDQMNKELQEEARVAMIHPNPLTKHVVRVSKTLNVLCEMEKRNQDIEVVSHEGTHQMAANTGLMPNEAHVPVWIAEGIATYFESPRDAAWAGVGTVNEKRLRDYRASARDPKTSNIDFVVSDMIFMQSDSGVGSAEAYAQAWALSHFLMAKRFDDLMKFYKLVGARRVKDNKAYSPKENLEVFKKAFGENTAAVGAEWHRYMQSLKTDVERVVAGE